MGQIPVISGDLPCDRVSTQLLRLLRTAEILRQAGQSLTTDEIRNKVADHAAELGEAKHSHSERTTRRDLTNLAIVGAVEYHRGTSGSGPARWKWRGGLAISQRSQPNEGTKYAHEKP